MIARRLAPPLPVFIGRVGENKPPACFRLAYLSPAPKKRTRRAAVGLALIVGGTLLMLVKI